MIKMVARWLLLRIKADLTPTLENTIVFTWLHLLDSGLPQLVRQRYGTELRKKTFSSLKPEISQTLRSLMKELSNQQDYKKLRAVALGGSFNKPKSSFRSCILCKTAGLPNHTSHYLSACKFLPEKDRRASGRSRLINSDHTDEDAHEDVYDEDITSDEQHTHIALIDKPCVCRVNIIQSPYLKVFYCPHSIRLTLDTGA